MHILIQFKNVNLSLIKGYHEKKVHKKKLQINYISNQFKKEQKTSIYQLYYTYIVCVYQYV